MKNHISYLLVIVLLVSVNTYSQDRDKNKLIQNFQDKYHGELFIKWNKVNAGPSKILGNNIYLHSNSVDKSTIPTLTRDFIKENEELLSTRNTQLDLENITELKNKFIVAYQQLYKGIPLWNIKLKLKLAKNGQVLMIKSPCFNNPQVSTQPKISLDQAKNNAAANYSVNIKNIQDGELVLYPEDETGQLYLCWQIKIESSNINKVVMIDAETGNKIYEYDLYCEDEIRGAVNIKSWSLPGQTNGSPDVEPYCRDLIVNVSGVGSVNTNSAGYYALTVPSAGNYTVTSVLDGPHCYVVNYNGSSGDSYSHTASTYKDENWEWQDMSHYNEYFVFDYMNKAWHEFNDKVSGFSTNYWQTNKMKGNANYPYGQNSPPVNGAADGGQIGITGPNHYGGCVYHEFSHNVICKAHNGWLGSGATDGAAMNEGIPDFFSCSFRNDPIREGTATSQVPERRLDTKIKYPGGNDPRLIDYRGQIIGGACWDLAHKSGISLNYVNDLVYEAVVNIGFNDTFGDFMDEILSADDNDGNIFNGTPHQNQIFDAFVNDHAIVGSVLTGGTISSGVTIYHNLQVIGNVTINSGNTVTVRPGVILGITPGISFTVNGTLNADGSQGTIHINNGGLIKVNSNYNNLINCVIDGSGSPWSSNVEIDGSYNTITYCTFQNAPWNALTVIGSSNNINHCDFHYNYYPVLLAQSYNSFNYNTVTNNYGIGVSIYYNGFIYSFNNNLIEHNYHNGIWVMSGGILYLEYGSNRIDHNCLGPDWNSCSTYEIINDTYSQLCITGNNTISSSWSNYIFNLAMTYGYETQSAWTVPAESDYWWSSQHGNDPSGCFWGSVDYSGWLISDPTQWEFGSLPSGKVISTQNPTSVSTAMMKIKSADVTNQPSMVITSVMADSIAGNSPESQGQFLVDLKNKMLNAMNDYNNPENNRIRPRLLGLLNGLSLLDSADVTQERGVIAALLLKHRKQLAAGEQMDSTDRLCSEAALVYETQNAIRNKDINGAQDLLKKYASLAQNDDSKRALLFAEENVDESLGKYTEAMAALKKAKAIKWSTQKRKYVSPSYDFIEKMLEEKAREAGRPINKQKIEELLLPTETAILQNYPNPFNPTTNINYQLLEGGFVTLKVYDMLGREVAVLTNGQKEAGAYIAIFNGSKYASGIYFVRLAVQGRDAKPYVKTMKMLMMK